MPAPGGGEIHYYSGDKQVWSPKGLASGVDSKGRRFYRKPDPAKGGEQHIYKGGKRKFKRLGAPGAGRPNNPAMDDEFEPLGPGDAEGWEPHDPNEPTDPDDPIDFEDRPAHTTRRRRRRVRI